MLIAQGTNQMTAGGGGETQLALANSRTPITVEANTTLSAGGPNELTALTSTTTSRQLSLLFPRGAS